MKLLSVVSLFFFLPRYHRQTHEQAGDVQLTCDGEKKTSPNRPYLFEKNELNSFNFTLLRPALFLTLRKKGRHPASVLLPFSENIKSKSDDAHASFLPKQSPPMHLLYSSHTSVTNLPSADDEWLIKVDQVNLLQLIDWSVEKPERLIARYCCFLNHICRLQVEMIHKEVDTKSQKNRSTKPDSLTINTVSKQPANLKTVNISLPFFDVWKQNCRAAHRR